MSEYVSKYDSLSAESELFNVPLRKEFLLSRIGKGKRVLDLGCLGGQISQLIQAQHNDVWCVELNTVAAERARQRGLRVKIANVEEGIPFENAAFDFVSAGELIEQLYDTRQFLIECGRVLKAGGQLILTTPNLNSLENRLRVLRGDYLEMAGAYPEDHFGDHVRMFNREKLAELLDQTGFQIVEVRGVPTLHSFNKSMGRLGQWMDSGLGLVGRVWPEGSKMLMVRAIRV